MSFGADWTCACSWANLDIRMKCRNCGAPNPEPRPEYVKRAEKAALMTARPRAALAPAAQAGTVAQEGRDNV